MDLPLWDSSDYQVAYESGCNTEDHLVRDFSFGYGRDKLEEDALNEKSRMQVLKIWINKADEDIVKLEEDILMLKCQLVWDNEDWSKQCSAALREKIDHLDNLTQSLMKDDRENALRLETVEVPPRLHDLLKPLLETYLAKGNQTETSIVQMPVPPAVELSNEKSETSTSNDNKKIEENVCTIILKTYERKSKSTELEERKINHPEQKKDAVIGNINESAHTSTDDEVSEKVREKPELVHVKLERRRPDKLEPADPMVKESSASMSTEKADSRKNEEKRNNNNKAISKAKVIPGRLQHQSKVTLSHLKLQETGSQISETVEVGSPRTEASSKVRKARVYRRATKEDVLSMKPLVKMRGEDTKFPETPEAVEALDTKMKNPPYSMNDGTGFVKKPRMELEHQIQIRVQQRREIEIVSVNQTKSIPGLKPEGRGPQKKCKESPEILQNSFEAEHIDKGQSSTKNLMVQKKTGVAEGLSKIGEKETQQQLNNNNIAGSSEVTGTPILLPQEVRKLSFSPQTTSEKEGLTNPPMKLAKKECDASNSTAEEATGGVKNVLQKLTRSELRAMAKSQNLRGVSKLRKADLQKRLGLQ